MATGDYDAKRSLRLVRVRISACRGLVVCNTKGHDG
jgi:hypothetical protein